ncbi:LacI family DNA-binding transcriptional regulator [Anaerobium acetethylicum]|uniref:LacI family transcriptional regulator, sucrose operon repressor n=1 Tax=Anaerobium acetethylicum TaxID=1619234 RepID=A0A1D3TXA1_9FIRM|nr:LacI family DNA-binding transcriptional regulator [Anaerobium acetethylicum]SCP98931.1 LacI family transcriptional regulator, sucrose operon repressor [Anaerobium acetethylicum]
MASIRDVAKRAHVGATTVSRYLNDNGYVSDETRIKIEKAIKELNYTPNELARHLFRKRTGIVAVLVPDVSHPFFGEFVKHVESKLYENGYKTMICSTTKEKNSEIEYIDMLNRHIVDGIISGVHTLEVGAYLNVDKPIVALDRYFNEKIPVVGADHYHGGEMAANCLINCGCRNVLQFQGAKSVNSPSHERHIAFERIMKMNGATVCTVELEWNRFEEDYFQQVVQEIFRTNPEIDGVFGADLLAIAYMKEVIRHGKKVPQDVKIIAYDGTYVTDIVSPTITAIVQPIEELAAESVRLLMNRIADISNLEQRVVLDVKLVEGESTCVQK